MGLEWLTGAVKVAELIEKITKFFTGAKEDKEVAFTEAVTAVQAALNATAAHLTSSDLDSINDSAKSGELAHLWLNAAEKVHPLDYDLFEELNAKSFSWSDLSKWTAEDHVQAQARVAYVQGEFRALLEKHYHRPATRERVLARPSFAELNDNYTLDLHDCPDISTSPNQCAVRLSRALVAAGILLDSDYTNNKCRHGFARGAQDLGAFLVKKWGPRDRGFEAPGVAPSVLLQKQGVILFANVPDFNGQGHIDLWDGTRTHTGEYWKANPCWFWELS